MSLKAFHIFFITVSALFLAGFGAWCLREYGDTDSGAFLVMGLLSFSAVGALSVYLPWFLKKLKSVGFLGLAAGLFLSPSLAQACAVCVGNPNSPLTKSANAGVLFLLGVVSVVLVGFGSLFVFWVKRMARLEGSL